MVVRAVGCDRSVVRGNTPFPKASWYLRFDTSKATPEIYGFQSEDREVLPPLLNL